MNKRNSNGVTVIVPRIGTEATVALLKRGAPIHDSRVNRERKRGQNERAAIRRSLSGE